MALRYWISASRYLPSAKYFSPLAKYFCLRTLGSREQPVNVAARTEQASSRRTATERLIGDSPTADAEGARIPSPAKHMILHGNRRKQLLGSYVDGGRAGIVNAECSCSA